MPFPQENMDKVCSLQLLTSVQHLVLNLTQQHDESREFVQFFHKQLGGILQVGTTHQDLSVSSHLKPIKAGLNIFCAPGHSQ